MRRIPILALAALWSCATNEYTGRRQLMLVSEAQEQQLGLQAYQEVLATERISQDPRETDPVQRVGRRIAATANRPDFKWDFHVIVDDQTVNAWCMPGGKIAFYTGIYPVLKDEAGMAFVMGHEVSHALLRHGGERMSQQMAAGTVGTLLAAGVGGRDPETQQMVMGAFGAATSVGVLLPFSRKHESEADALGLTLMARAGYDPRASVETWKRMGQMAGGGGTPEFLSTHPSHETRIEDLEALMPAAMAEFEKAARAPTAALPGIGGRKGVAKGQGVARTAFNPERDGASAATRKGDARRGRQPDGRPFAAFEFTFGRDVYLHAVKAAGPAGESTVEARSGIAAGDPKVLTLLRPDKGSPEIPPGRYTLTFEGAANGTRFRERLDYDVR